VPLVLPPGVEVGSGDDVFGDPLIEELEQRILFDKYVTSHQNYINFIKLTQQIADV
jgi:hypothetical protein